MNAKWSQLNFKYYHLLVFIIMIKGCSPNQFNKDTAYPILFAKTEVKGQVAREVYIKKHNDTSDRYTLAFFKNGKVSEAYYSLDKTRNGLYMKYHANGRLAEKGNFVHGKRKGLVYFFNENGKLESAIEFILFSEAPGGYHANQKYYFNGRGDTLKGLSNYYSLEGRDTINNGEDYELMIRIDAPVFTASSFSICNYDSLFHTDIKICDTFRMENHVGVYRTNKYHPGFNIIRGMIHDYKDVRDVSSGKVQTVGHEFYFKKEFYVKPKQ